MLTPDRRIPHLKDVKRTGVRRVISRRKKRTTGWFRSRKAGAMIPWESRLELDFLRTCEIDRTVQHVAAQPLRLEVELDDRVRVHFPDFLVTRRDGLTLSEVKLAKRAQQPAYQALFAAAALAASERTCDYAVFTENEVRGGARLANAVELLSFAALGIDPDLREGILASIAAGRACLADLAETKDRRRGALYAMCLAGEVFFDIDAPLHGDTLFHVDATGGV
jgi:hypothetical protein